MRMQTFARVAATRRTNVKPQFAGHVTDLILPRPDGGDRSQAFLVEQTANWTLPTHFHLEHQFQVFVAGSGNLGRHPIAPLTVHYASPHSAYGPLVSGAEGISYLTLRAVSDTGAWYLPESRAKLQTHIPKRQEHGAPCTYLNAAQLTALPGPVTEILIEPDASGLAAWVVRLPPGCTAAAPAQDAPAGGRFHIITQGALRLGGDECAALAAAFTAYDENVMLEAGYAGAEVIVVQYPAAARQQL